MEKPLSSFDLLDHYFSEKGKPLSLQEIGVEDKIKQMVKTPNALGKTNGHSLQGDFIEQILKGEKRFLNVYSVGDLYRSDFRTAEWAIGDATIGGTFNGTVVQVAEQYFLKGEIYYTLYDRFEDPIDFGNLFEGSFDIGDPFDITGSWNETINQPITKEQYEQFINHQKNRAIVR